MNTKNTRLIGIVIGFELLLLIPYIAMRFTNEVVWTALDFVTMGFMLLLTALGIELALRSVRVTWMKVAAVAAVLFVFVMVWGTLVHMGG
jgi:hypothetical protein